MQFRLLRLRFRRRLRKGQQQVEDLGVQAEESLEQHLFKRIDRLLTVRRFVVGWLGLVILLIVAVLLQNFALSGYYQKLSTIPGGIYTEGVQGRFTNANPLFATSDADLTVSRLIFAGLLKYDASGKLVGDLASSYEADEHGTAYTIHLRPHLTWQDGKPLTSADVAFTYQAIQNPDTQSPLQNSWQGITVTVPDAQTVVFKLPSALASFPYNLTNGIVPQHLLARTPAVDLRSADFNTLHPVGAGPFAWQAVQVSGDGTPRTASEQVALTPFKNYYAGQPKLQKFVVQVFADQDQMVNAFRHNQLTAVEGLPTLPDDLRHKSSVTQHNLTLRAATMVFFKNSSGVLADQQVRQALVQGADVPAILKKLDYPARQVREPLLVGQLAYDPSLAQASFDRQAAEKQLAAAGWQISKRGIRTKDGNPLAFSLTAADTAEDKAVVAALKQQWSALGVKLTTRLLDSSDFQNALSYHDYDAILDGISIGVDPDVFVYWDSSQADIRSPNRLNLSEYKNDTADTSLEAGRTRLDPALRVIKYKPFLQAWQQDSPALGLYQPRLLYATNRLVNGLSDTPISSPVDRFSNVQNWEIRQAKVTD